MSSLCDPGTERAVEWIGWRVARRWLFHKIIPSQERTAKAYECRYSVIRTTSRLFLAGLASEVSLNPTGELRVFWIVEDDPERRWDSNPSPKPGRFAFD